MALFLLAALLAAAPSAPLPAVPAQAPATSAPVPDAAALPKIPPASLDDSLEIAGDALPAELADRMYIDARVNGRGPFRFLVDSGADRSVIGTGLARRLGLPAESTVRLQGMAGSADVGTVYVEELRLGTSKLSGLVTPALPERYLGAAGLIGIDALAEQRLKLDFDARSVTIEDRRQPATAREDGEIIVTARRRKGQLILTQASVGFTNVYAVIDTGTDITVGNAALERRVFGGRRPPAPQYVTLVSVTGQSFVARLATLPEMRIGGVLLKNVTMAFADAPPFALFGLDKDPAMLLGTDVLKSFKRLSLDFGARKVRFTLRR